MLWVLISCFGCRPVARVCLEAGLCQLLPTGVQSNSGLRMYGTRRSCDRQVIIKLVMVITIFMQSSLYDCRTLCDPSTEPSSTTVPCQVMCCQSVGTISCAHSLSPRWLAAAAATVCWIFTSAKPMRTSPPAGHLRPCATSWRTSTSTH